MEKSLHRLLKIVFITVIVNTQFVVGQSVDDLQNRLDNPVQTRAGEVETVDLSKYEALERERPLYVRNGKSYKFINGTLKRTLALTDSALLVISAGSLVELGDGAVLSGGTWQSGHELVLLETGSLKLSSGEIKDCGNPASTIYDNAVLVKTQNSSFEMTDGKITDTRGVENLGGAMTFTDGSIKTGFITSNSDFLLSGTVSVPSIVLQKGAKIRITSALEIPIKIWPSSLSELKLSAIPDDQFEGIIVATGDNYTLTENDLKMLSSSRFTSSEWKFVLENNSVVIRSAKGIVDAVTLQAYLNNAPYGTKEQPVRVEIPAEGIELDRPVMVPAGKHFLITGGSITVNDLQNGDFAFNVQDNASLTFDNIVLDGGNYKGQTYFMVRGTLQINNTVTFRNTSGYKSFYYIFDTGLANVYGGDISGVERGVDNSGSFNFYGGSFATCTYGVYNYAGGHLVITDGVINESCTHSIYSYADFRTKGNCGMNNISIAKDCCIYMTSEMNNGWVVSFINDDFTTDTPIIAGEGYILKETDVNKVRFIVPQGYESYLSPASGCIQIRMTGEAAVRTEKELKLAIENATGTCGGEPTVIKIEGEVLISTIYIHDKSVKLTGGTLKRASGYTDASFLLSNACLTLEDVVVDGNKTTFTNDQSVIWSAFDLSKQAKLTINKGTEIKNYRVRGTHAGLIWIADNSACTLVMNGGTIRDNDLPDAELITDCTNKYLSFEMTGGSIEENTTGYGIACVKSFTMSGGIIENNVFKYPYNVKMQTGLIKSGGIIKDNQGGLLVNLDLKIEGDGTNVMDSVVLYDPAARISRNGKQKSELVLNHYAYNAGKLTAGTVVVAGCDGYQLTEDDLNKYMYKNSDWKLELSGNTIVLKESEAHSFESGDDLQDFLDGLGQSGNVGTEKDPIDIVFASAPIRFSHPLCVPEGAHLLFSGVSFIREETSLKDMPASEAMLEIPSSASLSLVNTTIDGVQKEVGEALVSVSGQLKVGSGCVIKGGSNKNGALGAAIHVASTGVLTMTGGTISDNVGKQGSAVFNEGNFVLAGGSISNNTSEIGNVVNNENSTFMMTGGTIHNNKVTQGCGGVFIGENCLATFTGGEISANAHSDVYSWSDVKFSGNTKVAGLYMSVAPAKLLVSSALQYNLKLASVAETVVPGIVVAQGTGGYKLTAQDLAKISCPDEKWVYALKEGNVVLVDKGSTAIEEVAMHRKVYMENGHLILTGQRIGEPYFIYAVSGKLVHAGKITSDCDSYYLTETGLFIVKCGRNTFKVVNLSR